MTKSKIMAVLAVGLVLVGPVGCTTTGQLDVPRTARVAREAAEIGTSEYLAFNPTERTKFVLAANQLRTLQRAPELSLDTILDMVRQLPVDQLGSDEARIAIRGARLLISAWNVPQASPELTADLQLLAGAIADGIEAGLPPAPVVLPAPTK